MSAQHTPGPWTVKRIASYYAGYEIQPAATRARQRALGHDDTGAGSPEEAKANAALIAAAPDLLAALQGALAELERANRTMLHEAGVAIANEVALEAARVAIAKATGAAP